jgi:hypothetical protein
MGESEDLLKVIDYCYRKGWAADGLPVVPPTEERVHEFIKYVERDPGEAVATMNIIGRACTVEKAAINAVMAGCLPEYLPVVLAALEALEDNRYHFHGSSTSPAGCGPLLVINGPIRNKLGINSGVNVLGPGCRANATIGRTICLIQQNVFSMRPGLFDQSTHGFPGKYSFCIGENEEESPWEPLHVEKNLPPGRSTVTVFGALGSTHVNQRQPKEPEQILLTIADTMCHLGSINSHAQTALLMGPEHARLIADRNWSKADVKSFLHQHARRPLEDLRQVSKAYQGVGGAGKPSADGYLYQGQTPEDILLVVAGGNNAGISTVIHPWGRRLSSAVGVSPAADLPSMDHVTKLIREPS